MFSRVFAIYSLRFTLAITHFIIRFYSGFVPILILTSKSLSTRVLFSTDIHGFSLCYTVTETGSHLLEHVVGEEVISILSNIYERF